SPLTSRGMNLLCAVAYPTHTQDGPPPMLKIPVALWIANAAACLCGRYGDVSAQAQHAGCSRQTAYDHAQKVHAAVEAEYAGGTTRQQLLDQLQALRHENTQLWAWLEQTIDFPEIRRQEFTITAAAMGLSLNQIGGLMAIVLGAAARPSRSALHRVVQAAGRRAGQVLKRLDARCRALILVGCLDEIFFHGRPVLVGVEPASRVWFLGTRAADRTGGTWLKALHCWTALEFVVADAGTGLQNGIALLQQGRRAAGQTVPESALDVFHTTQEAQRVLRQQWQRVERLWEAAEATEAQVRHAGRQGQDRRGPAARARRAWDRAIAAFRAYERGEAGWTHARAALAVFRPDGRLNDRPWARQQIAEASPLLCGRDWSKVRGFLEATESQTFLDRLHRHLEQAEPEPALRAELVRLWWLRRQRPRVGAAGVPGGSGHVAYLVQTVACQKRSESWAVAYRRVSRVLRQTVRASSAVEGMNSVLRMHQARHRTVTQDLLDLKRLYWNSRPFGEGKRKGRCPYELLGLGLPRYDFWALLQMPVHEPQVT
ncbi:MAG: hypothetical protein LC749_12560, partial [Actinobacteria bacterium]|nr:hypothetical protein [Actinomycetota bacterium]